MYELTDVDKKKLRVNKIRAGSRLEKLVLTGELTVRKAVKFAKWMSGRLRKTERADRPMWIDYRKAMMAAGIPWKEWAVPEEDLNGLLDECDEEIKMSKEVLRAIMKEGEAEA